MEIINKQLSPEASVKVEIKDGKLSLVTLLDTKGLDGEVRISVDSDYFLDSLAEKIKGSVDDAIIAVLKAALKNLK